MTPQEIEAARKSLGLSIRAAAKRAGISEGHWRHIAAGSMRVGGVEVPVNTKASTLAAMEQAVRGESPAADGTIRSYSNEELADEVRRRLVLGRDESDAQAKPGQKSRRGDDVRDAAPDVLAVESGRGSGKGAVSDSTDGLVVEVRVDQDKAVPE